MSYGSLHFLRNLSIYLNCRIYMGRVVQSILLLSFVACRVCSVMLCFILDICNLSSLFFHLSVLLAVCRVCWPFQWTRCFIFSIIFIFSFIDFCFYIYDFLPYACFGVFFSYFSSIWRWNLILFIQDFSSFNASTHYYKFPSCALACATKFDKFYFHFPLV